MPRADASTRRTPPVLIALACVLLAARAATGWYEHHHEPKWPDLIRWRAPAEVNESEGKPVLYEFALAGCEPCAQMQQDLFADEERAEWINREFQPARVNAEDESAVAHTLRERFSVDGYPALAVVG